MHKMESLKIENILVDRLICDKCKSALICDGIVYTTYPPQYGYSCPNCNYKEKSTNAVYPIYYLELSDGTMLQI